MVPFSAKTRRLSALPVAPPVMFFSGRPEPRSKPVTGKPGQKKPSNIDGARSKEQQKQQGRVRGGSSTTTSVPAPTRLLPACHGSQPQQQQLHTAHYTKPTSPVKQPFECLNGSPRIAAQRQRVPPTDGGASLPSLPTSSDNNTGTAADTTHHTCNAQPLQPPKVLRHMLSSLSEVWGGGYQPAPELLEPRRGPPAEPQPLATAELKPQASRQLARRKQAIEVADEPWSSAAAPLAKHLQHQESGNFQQRSIARLGGDGVSAALVGSGGPQSPASRVHGGAYMAALHDLKPGLSDSQRAKAAAAREQLKLDLEAQIAERREAEARRKAEEAAREAEEERRIQQYYAKLKLESAEACGSSENSDSSVTKAAEGNRPQGVAAQSGLVARQQQGRRSSHHHMHSGCRAEASVPALGVQFHVSHQACISSPTARPMEPEDGHDSGRGSQADRVGQEPNSWLPPVSAPSSTSGAVLAAQQALLQQQLWSSPYGAALLGLAPAAAAAVAQQQARLPVMAPPLAPLATVAGGEVANLLRGLQEEQARLRQQVAEQTAAVGQLQGDVKSALHERDQARKDLQRVQRMLENRGSGSTLNRTLQQGLSSWSVGDDREDGEGFELAAASQLLPAAAARIPSHPTTARGGFQSLQQQQVAQKLAAGTNAQGQMGQQNRTIAGHSRPAAASSKAAAGRSDGSRRGSNQDKPKLWRK